MSCDCNPPGKKPTGSKTINAQAAKNYYSYYDTPDGCDVTKKIGAATRLGAMIGSVIATQDVLFYSHAVGFGPILKRYMFHAGPFMLMGATFAAVSHAMLQYRQEDDHWNYFAGGFACGPIVAFYLGSCHAVLIGGLLLGSLAAARKEALLTGTDFFPSPPGHMRTVRDWKNNFNFLYKDPIEEMIKTCNVHNDAQK